MQVQTEYMYMKKMGMMKSENDEQRRTNVAKNN